MNHVQTNSQSHAQTLNYPDGKEVKLVVQQTATATQQTATDVDQVKRLSFSFISATESHPYFKAPNCAKAFTDGSPHRIPQLTITSHALLITKKRLLGSFKAASFRTGSQRDHFFGFMENVRPSSCLYDSSNMILYYSWLGQERSVVRGLLL